MSAVELISYKINTVKIFLSFVNLSLIFSSRCNPFDSSAYVCWRGGFIFYIKTQGRETAILFFTVWRIATGPNHIEHREFLCLQRTKQVTSVG